MVHFGLEITFRDPAEIATKEPTFILFEALFWLLGIACFFHALHYGGRVLTFWLASIIHGVAVESLCKMHPDYDFIWHAQSSMMVNSQQLPVHVILANSVILYFSFMAVCRMHLHVLSESLLVAIATVLLDAPYAILGTKFLWWTYHDTDPNLLDRVYGAPWMRYALLLSFNASFCLVLHGARKVLTAQQRDHTGPTGSELVAMVVAGFFSTPLGILQTLFTIHMWKGYFGLHTSTCFAVLLFIYLIIVYTLERSQTSIDSLLNQDLDASSSIGAAEDRRTDMDGPDCSDGLVPSLSGLPMSEHRSRYLQYKRYGGGGDGSGAYGALAPISDAGEINSSRSSDSLADPSNMSTASSVSAVSSRSPSPLPPSTHFPSTIAHSHSYGSHLSEDTIVAKSVRALRRPLPLYARFSPAAWRTGPSDWYNDAIFVCLILYFTFFVAAAFFSDPSTVESVGFHQQIGDCEHFSVVKYLSFYTAFKHTYLCSRNFDEPFSLLSDDAYTSSALPAAGSKWYKIYGTPHSNFAEFFTAIVHSSVVGLLVLGHIMRYNRRIGPNSGASKSVKFE